jgi:glycosyltransferase involved in cell wall biosynthesis
MKILFAWHNCDIGGVETWMLGLAKIYRRLGHTCELFFFRRGPFADHVPPDVAAHYGDLSDCLRLVHRHRFDVVHAMTDVWDTGITAVRQLGVQLVLTNQVHPDAGWNRFNCDALVGCSDWTARAQQQLSGVAVRTVFNGVDLDRFRPPENVRTGPPIVAWVGRGADLQQKRIELLARIAPYLRAGGCRLWVADPDGPGRVPPSVATALTAAAEFWGAVPPGRMPEFFQGVATSGGCVLSTSAYEGLSLAYLEAQAGGCPVIGPDVPGVREGIDPRHGGVLFPAELQPEEIARLVLKELADTGGMASRRLACRQFVAERYSLEAAARQYLEIYASRPATRRGRVFPALPFPTRSGFERFVRTYWASANNQFHASRAFAEAGDWDLAASAVRSSFRTCPTLYLRPRRLRHLLTSAGRGTVIRRGIRPPAASG